MPSIGVFDNDDDPVMLDDPIDNPPDEERVNMDAFVYTTHNKMVAKLLVMLDSWQVPKTGFQSIVDWYEEAKLLVFRFLFGIKHVKLI